MRTVFRLGFVVSVCGLAPPGCGAPEDEVFEIDGALIASNALSANALSANALSANALSANALSANALSANALSANALSANGLRDPLAREFLKYVVSCALPKGEGFGLSVDGVLHQFDGELGLAPAWGQDDGSCDGECQRWVSACVMARVDFLGVKRLISLRGNHRALQVSPRELCNYPVREATYYGNLFAQGQHRYLCLSPRQVSNERVCGPSLANCPMTVMGSCADVCRKGGPAGSFRACRTGGAPGEESRIDEAITVFLPR